MVDILQYVAQCVDVNALAPVGRSVEGHPLDDLELRVIESIEPEVPMHPCYVKLLRIHHDGVQLPRTTEASCRHHRAQRPGRVAGAHFGDDKLTAGGAAATESNPSAISKYSSSTTGRSTPCLGMPRTQSTRRMGEKATYGTLYVFGTQSHVHFRMLPSHSCTKAFGPVTALAAPLACDSGTCVADCAGANSL